MIATDEIKLALGSIGFEYEDISPKDNPAYTILEEGIEEQGTSGVLEWQISKCLNQDENCRALNCKYFYEGIGESGNIDPFD